MNHQEKYNRWWLGKDCRPAHHTKPFKKVTEVRLIGPPSFFYGAVMLVYSDGSYDNIAPVKAFRPRKSDVEVTNA